MRPGSLCLAAKCTVINLSPTNPSTVSVYEVWRSEADHDASLQVEIFKALALRARPLVESFERVKLQPMVAGTVFLLTFST